MSIKDLFIYAGTGTMLLAMAGTVAGMLMPLFFRRTPPADARFAPTDQAATVVARPAMRHVGGQARRPAQAPVSTAGSKEVASVD